MACDPNLPLDAALAHWQSKLGSVATFPRVAAALASLLRAARVDAANARLFHATLRLAIGNGRGPKVPKLRAAFAELFDAALGQIDAFTPPPLAADVSLWAFAAATHARLVRPERALHAASFAPLMAQLCDCLRRLHDEAPPSTDRPTRAGGALRDAICRQLFEGLERANALVKQPWARPPLLEALALAQKLGQQPRGGNVWQGKERAEIEKMASTARARGLA